ncbi:MAG TPA: hypothetical protein VFT16_04750 [Candidatus Saccharimonadales bacterium]|nr:hypothetical protein [Candidatus Saccharimonadales bacterium]
MDKFEHPCLDASTDTEQLGRAMAGRILAGIGAVDKDSVPDEHDMYIAARIADKVAGDNRCEPFATAASYLRTANGLGVAACARRWASLGCPDECPLYSKRYSEA